MQGNTLYPLNTLKEIYPDIYKQQFSKYIGREILTRHRIPFLNCLWNDVLHFSAVNPKEIKQARIEAGGNPDFTMNCYEVDPELIAPENAIVYLYAHADVKDKLNENNFVSFNPQDTVKYSLMPQATKDYYREMISEGKPTLLFHRIPHILYQGTLDIKDLKIVSV
jgi:hypothetical protein